MASLLVYCQSANGCYFIYCLQFYENQQANNESTSTTMSNVSNEVLQDVSKEVVDDVLKSPPGGAEGDDVTDETTKPANVSIEKTNDKYTCCALKCDEFFNSPDALR